MNFDEFKSVVTHCIALYANGDKIIYFDSFGVEHIPKEIKDGKIFKEDSIEILKILCLVENI